MGVLVIILLTISNITNQSYPWIHIASWSKNCYPNSFSGEYLKPNWNVYQQLPILSQVYFWIYFFNLGFFKAESCSPGLPGTHYICSLSWLLTYDLLSAGLQACATTSGFPGISNSYLWFGKFSLFILMVAVFICMNLPVLSINSFLTSNIFFAFCLEQVSQTKTNKQKNLILIYSPEILFASKCRRGFF